MNTNEFDLTRKGLIKCECPVCHCKTAVVAKIEVSICFMCRKQEHLLEVMAWVLETGLTAYREVEEKI